MVWETNIDTAYDINVPVYKLAWYTQHNTWDLNPIETAGINGRIQIQSVPDSEPRRLI